MNDQNDRLERGDEPPPEAAAFEVEQSPPDDEGNANAELKEADDE
jgi:hypothetical protein